MSQPNDPYQQQPAPSGYPAPPPPSPQGGYPAPQAGGYPTQQAPGGYPAQQGQGYGAQGPIGKQRNGIAVVFLAIITLGIYWLVYVFKTSKEIKNYSGIGIGPGLMLVISLFVGIVTPFLLGHDVAELRARYGLPPKVSAATGAWVLLPLVGIFIFSAKVQGALNEVWQSQGGARP
ncbi:MAG: hypothetical protein DLM58_17335 [Pseudonocardiales bacterium]|nr:MAG: hypothetical protein DLM58_17335 [Pseudonocardiales bacterium]